MSAPIARSCQNKESGYYCSKSTREKVFKALHAKGVNARQFMDDPKFNPGKIVDWNCSFACRLVKYADWRTFRGWILRGMNLYHDGMDEGWLEPLVPSPAVLLHLADDLGRRQWAFSHCDENFLELAVSYGDIRSVKGLLDLGCSPNFSRKCQSPLRQALMDGENKIAKLLYERGGRNVDSFGIEYPIPAWISECRS